MNLPEKRTKGLAFLAGAAILGPIIVGVAAVFGGLFYSIPSYVLLYLCALLGFIPMSAVLFKHAFLLGVVVCFFKPSGGSQ